LSEFANPPVKEAFASGLFIFADSDLKFDQPQAEVVFDRDKVRAQGVDLTQAGQDLSTLLGGDYVNRFSIQGRSYKVIPQIKRAERLTPDQLEQIYVTGSGNKLVPLSTFATLKTTTEPRELKKFQQLNAVTIQGVIQPNVPLDTSGALMFSFLGLTTLNIYSQVGLITLVGLVSKNGILIVEFANHLQETGKDKLAAIIEAATTRLRPILMTTAATVVGHFP